VKLQGVETMKKASYKHKSKKHKKQVICPYCGAQALLRDGSFLFEDPFVKHLYVCVRYPTCDAYVAAHHSSMKPMGSLANESLRRKRMLAHHYFDQLWRCNPPVFTRKQAYGWLGDRLGGHIRHLHIGYMGEGMCDLVILEAKRVLRLRKENYSGSKAANLNERC